MAIKGGRAAKRKGSAGEREFVRLLNKYLTTLHAVRTFGSGAFATRVDGRSEPALEGDAQVRREDNHIVGIVEVKRQDPNSTSGPITISKMNGNEWRKGREMLGCRHDRGTWLCSMWVFVWDRLCKLAGGEPAWGPGPAYNIKTRGVNVNDIQDMIAKDGGVAICLAGVVYLDIPQLADLFEMAYGEVDDDEAASFTDGLCCEPGIAGPQ